MNHLLIFIGGGLGSLARYTVTKYLSTFSSYLPYGTISANIISSFILGFTFYYLGTSKSNPSLYLLLGAGFCGGFSTFSTFSLENFEFLKNNQFLQFSLNIFINIVTCIIAILAGYISGKSIS